MDTAKRIEVSSSQDKINLINGTYQKELDYWKEAALEKSLNQNGTDKLKDSTRSSLF